VERVAVKDVRLPVQMQRAMATEAEATREARAVCIAASGLRRYAFIILFSYLEKFY
jgi:erythrocyte band 7 integral membrane protein